jgi:hypothetical protein
MTATLTTPPRPSAGPAARISPTNIAFVLAPIGVLAGWTIMRLGASHSTGAGWVAAHSVWLISYALFGYIIAELYRRARTPRAGGRTAALIGGAAAAAGLLAVLGQMVVDMIVGIAASDRAHMHELFEQAYDVPGVRPVLYGFGPVLLLVGLAALVIQVTVLRRVSGATTALALAGIVLIAADGAIGATIRLLIMPVGISCLWLAFNTIRRSATANAKSSAA